MQSENVERFWRRHASTLGSWRIAMKKSKTSCTVIGGADGPTSVFIVGKSKRKGLQGIKDRARNSLYQKRREKIKAQIIANPHSIEEVISYIQTKYHAVEQSESSSAFKEQRKCCKQNLVQKYQPELIGESFKLEPPDIEDEQSVRDFLKRADALQEKAANVPEELFPMDYHIYQIKVENLGEIEFEIEMCHDYFSAISSCGRKGNMKKVRRIVKDIYRYYGVSEQDIAENSERYMSLVAELADD